MGDVQMRTVRDPVGGSNQSGLRDQNARLVLSYIRRHGAMASAEIARRSGLSAQTVSNIVRALEADRLLQRGPTRRGRVGKPSVPMTLNPEGAYGLGLSIGRRSLEMVLVDFTGRQVATEVITYAYPAKAQVMAFVRDTLPVILEKAKVPKAKVAGLGVARPGRIWDWGEFINAPSGAMYEWRTADLDAALAGATGLPVVLENDATAACVAEHLLGRGHDLSDFAYLFVGTFIGGGLVVDGKIMSGPTRNAAALGPLPVPDGMGGSVQLLDVASLHVLERAVREAGLDGDAMRGPAPDWRLFEPMLTDWIEKTAHNLAIASAAIASIVEVEAILVAGAFPDEVRKRLTERMASAFADLNVTGIEDLRIEEATVGKQARSIGAALLPIHASFFVV